MHKSSSQRKSLFRNPIPRLGNDINYFALDPPGLSLPYKRNLLNSPRLPRIPSQPFHHISLKYTGVWQAQLSSKGNPRRVDSRYITLLNTEPLHGLITQFESPHLLPLNLEIYLQVSSSLIITERNSSNITCYPNPPLYKRRKLSKSGYATCRRRHIVCNEKKPFCKLLLPCLFFNSLLTITLSRYKLHKSW